MASAGSRSEDAHAGRSGPIARRRTRPEERAYINAIGTAVPQYDIHEAYIDFALSVLPHEQRRLFRRMVERSGIAHRWSPLEPGELRAGVLTRDGLYRRGAFPSTAERMRRFESVAPSLAEDALSTLERHHGSGWRRGLTHLIVTSCTGLQAPGLDLMLIERFGLDRSIERTFVGFMGCSAAVNALKLARHVVRSEPSARVLMLNLELCSLHLQETMELEQALLFLIFADGCAATLVTGEPIGLALERFGSSLLPDSHDQMRWSIGDDGFDMRLSGQVRQTISRHLPAHMADLLSQRRPADVDLWAVHPGGRSILDAVQQCLELGPDSLVASRAVLNDYGNMSSATVMFVLARMMQDAAAGRLGCALAFGPGLSVESMLFRQAA